VIVNELSKAIFTARPLDVNGAEFVPVTARYRLDDKVSTTEIIAWTALTPALAMEIAVPATDHAMIDVNTAFEDKVLTVETDDGTANAHVEEFEYQVRNLQFVPI
jgi:hypothetical protein